MALRHGNTFYYRNVEFQLTPLFGGGIACLEDTQNNILIKTPTGGELAIDNDEEKTLWIADPTDTKYHRLYSIPCYSKNFSGTLSISDSTLTEFDATSPTYAHKCTIANTTEITMNPSLGEIYFSVWVEFAANATGIRAVYCLGGTSGSVNGSAVRNAAASGTTSISMTGRLTGTYNNTPLEFAVYQNSGGALNVVNYRLVLWQRGHPTGMLDQ